MSAQLHEMEVAPREMTPPPIQAPTAKERKYDRQLRLWAASGQIALEESHVLLIVGEEQTGSNSSVAGAETLKNLILPGIGNFTIADGAIVSEADQGINFFLETSSLGKSRAEETVKFLQELNPDVQGHFISRPLREWLPQDESLTPYNLVVVCGSIETDLLQRICRYASTSSIPVIQLRSVGFYSSFSIQLPHEFPVVDTHPDPESTQDLRLLAPWPALSEASSSLGDLQSLTDHDHGHIPYVLVLLYYLEQYRATHNGTNPSTFKEKTEFRGLVRSGARTNNPEGGEENFDEACAAVLKSINEPPVGSGCKEMFQMPSCQHLSGESRNFWIVANAIKTFYEEHHVLPLPGTLPDMKATSAEYIKLQNIYKSKARADVAEVTRFVRETEQKLGRKEKAPDAEIELFCKNAAHVRVLSNPEGVYLPSARIAQSDPKIISVLRSTLEADWEEMLPVFIALASTASSQEQVLDLNMLNSDPDVLENLSKAAEEVKRAEGGELHNISSVTGGMVAQEVIKLLTKQYVPVDGSCVFDGIRSKSAVFKI